MCNNQCRYTDDIKRYFVYRYCAYYMYRYSVRTCDEYVRTHMFIILWWDDDETHIILQSIILYPCHFLSFQPLL